MQVYILVTKLELTKYEVMSSPAIVRLVSQRITNRNVVNICSVFNQYAAIDVKTPIEIKSPVNINTRHASSDSKSPVHMMGLGKGSSNIYQFLYCLNNNYFLLYILESRVNMH